MSGARHPSSPRRRRPAVWARVAAVAAIVVVVSAGVISAVVLAGRNGGPPTTAATGPPGAAASGSGQSGPVTPADQLLEGADAAACAVSFAGDGIADAPALETQGGLYQRLPIPQRDGSVFAGWYTTPEAAAAYDVLQRINGADAVTCTDRQVTLYGSWKTPEEVAALDVGVPILMYHQFTTKPEGEDNWLKANYAYIADFEAHMKHLADTGVYLPTWDELSAFIDGKLYIPKICAIVTDDDADPTWTTLAAPLVDKYKILTTSFVIGVAPPGPPPNMYVIQRSHTHDMHTAGDNGKGRMVNWSAEQIAADMETSVAALGGMKQVMAYPFGHYDDRSKEGLRLAGFEMARTTEPGYVRAGADKLALPTMRINYGMGLDDFISIVG